jgi:hypothetical protein
VVKDATADYSDEMMHAALDINLPNYASAIATTDEVIASIGVTYSPLRVTPATEVDGTARLRRMMPGARQFPAGPIRSK